MNDTSDPNDILNAFGPLVSLAEMSTAKLVERKLVSYDAASQTAIVRVVESEQPTIVHFVGDSGIGLLYEIGSLEVVGFFFEGQIAEDLFAPHQEPSDGRP